ncbi:MAG: universal stress protein [Hyphomicrobiales bacterium]|nr:universal stress protein [Hyphomicrobiales bacterium]
MYNCIVVPVDLTHKDKLGKAIEVAADLARLYKAALHFVGVTATPPSAVAHNPEEFAKVLAQYAKDEGARLGLEIGADTVISRDPAVDLDEDLDKEIHKLGADLVVMASHVPHFREYVFASNAGYLASHTDVSVLVVR